MELTAEQASALHIAITDWQREAIEHQATAAAHHQTARASYDNGNYDRAYSYQLLSSIHARRARTLTRDAAALASLKAAA